MANKSVSTFAKNGYGQVEPNHLSAQRTAQIYAQLPANSGIDVLENGQYVKYDYAKNEVNFSGDGEWMLVYNEEKVYGDYETRKDYAMTKESQVRGIIVPRVFKTNVGDIYTTNFVAAGPYIAGDKLTIGENGVPTKNEGSDLEGLVLQVVANTTLPDGQAAVKVMRIQ